MLWDQTPEFPIMVTEARHPDLPEWLREFYPFRTRMLDVGGQRLSFVDEGPSEAAPLVLLHGNPTWSFLYRDLIQRARDRYRVIAPDHIGFGLSDKPANAGYHTLGQHIGNLAQLVEALGLRNLTLVMHGWGGPVGMGYAVAHPQNVGRLVLTSTWVSSLPRVKMIKPPLGMRLASKGRLGAWLDSLLSLSMNSYFALDSSRPLQDMVLEAYKFPFPNVATRVAPFAFTRWFLDPDRQTLEQLAIIQRGLKNIDAPASILCGARDRRLGKLPAYVLHDELKHASKPVFLPDVAHYLPEEAPDVLAETVLQTHKPVQASPADHVFKIIG